MTNFNISRNFMQKIYNYAIFTFIAVTVKAIVFKIEKIAGNNCLIGNNMVSL